MPLIRIPLDALGANASDAAEFQPEAVVESAVDSRRRAARELPRDPASIPVIADCLAYEDDPRVRDALFGRIMDIGGTPAAELLGQLIRSDNAGLRGGAIEGLKRLKSASVAVLDMLMTDSDSDVRLLAIEVTRSWPCNLAMPRLRRVFDQETHVNVCIAAVDVATEVGTEDLLPSLDALQGRFADEPFLTFAIEVACARIRGDRDRAN